MAIQLDKELKRRAVHSLRKYLDDELEVDAGDLQSELLLDHVLQLLGPAIYNQAVGDTQAWLNEKLQDLDGDVFEAEPLPEE
jgi:uncharacterized protein (DUF2164 family)